MTSEVRYAVGDLARLAGVSRRTVRYYVQEGLIPEPHGLGRGNHYGEEHLDRILRVKAMQEAGRTLDEIRRAFRKNTTVSAAADLTVEREIWRRLTVAPGVELHVAGHLRLPPPGRLHELATWCRLYMATEQDKKKDEGNDA